MTLCLGVIITPCNKIDKPQIFRKCYDVPNNVAYLMMKKKYARNDISK